MKLITPALVAMCMASSASATGLGDSSQPTLQSEISAALSLYASDAGQDPHRPIVLSETPSEMSEIYAALDERIQPFRIYTFRRDDGSEETDEPSTYTLSPTTFTPGSAEDMIISFIRRFEAGKHGYDAVWHGNKTPLPSRPTEMTVCEVRDWQLTARRHQASTAIGLFQIVGGTYRTLLDRVDLPCDTKFDQKTQDMLGLALLLGSGWQEFKSGSISPTEFGYRLAGVWAAFPATYGEHRGFSRYRYVGDNRHQIELPEYMTFLNELDRQIRSGSLPDFDQEPSAPALPEIVFTSNEIDRPQIETAPVTRVISFFGN